MGVNSHDQALAAIRNQNELARKCNELIGPAFAGFNRGTGPLPSTSAAGVQFAPQPEQPHPEELELPKLFGDNPFALGVPGYSSAPTAVPIMNLANTGHLRTGKQRKGVKEAMAGVRGPLAELRA